MNHRMILYFTGWVIKIEGILMLLPFLVSLLYKEDTSIYLGSIAGGCVILGFLLTIKKPKDSTFYAREGFVSVALCWIVLSILGAMPFYISGVIPSFIDALFETISGFTTTGASILSDVEALPKGMLFWRSFTHWAGGMGVLVFVLAFMPLAAGENIHIMRAESPGPSVGKLVPKMRTTAKILYGIYLGITIIEIIILCLTGMDLFESSLITFGCVGTGGFGILNSSAASYSALQQGIITTFMILCGVNFNLYFLILAKRGKEAIKSEELWAYLGIMFSAAFLIAFNISNGFKDFGNSFRHSIFQVASCMTTTGFSTVDFNLWPTFSKVLLLIVMFVGGSAGSTAGGLKVSRIVIEFKTILKEMRYLIHPRSVKVIKFEGKTIEHSVLRSTNVYFMIYLLVFMVSVLLVSMNGFDFETTFSAVTATFNNIGPGLGAAGPSANFAGFSVFSKAVMCFDMLAGRLEIFPILLLFSPRTWKRQL